jgi:dTMP kinase
MKKNLKGQFIVFEGIEACGKSTQITKLQNLLQSQAVFTREPGGTEVADEIRKILTLGAIEKLAPLTELLLLAAARNDHIERVIKPALANGTNVICDRFVASTYAYQGAALGIPIQEIDKLQQMVLGSLYPDKIIIFDLDPQIARKRILSRNKDEDERYEKFGIEFHEKIRKSYLDQAENNPARFVVIDANRSEDEIHSEVVDLCGL